jgi:hypothetical protein
MLLNMSVWETVEALQHYVYRTAHAELLRERDKWFEKISAVYQALWWVPVAHMPGIDEAKKRLAYFDAYGATPFAFTFKSLFLPETGQARRPIPPHARSQGSRISTR